MYNIDGLSPTVDKEQLPVYLEDNQFLSKSIHFELLGDPSALYI